MSNTGDEDQARQQIIEKRNCVKFIAAGRVLGDYSMKASLQSCKAFRIYKCGTKFDHFTLRKHPSGSDRRLEKASATSIKRAKK